MHDIDEGGRGEGSQNPLTPSDVYLAHLRRRCGCVVGEHVDRSIKPGSANSALDCTFRRQEKDEIFPFSERKAIHECQFDGLNFLRPCNHVEGGVVVEEREP